MTNNERINKSSTSIPIMRLFCVKICFKMTNEEQPQLAFSYVSEFMGKIDGSYLTAERPTK